MGRGDLAFLVVRPHTEAMFSLGLVIVAALAVLAIAVIVALVVIATASRGRHDERDR